MQTTIRHNLGQLNDTLQEYQRLRNKSWPDVMAKQGGKLGFILSRNLRGIAPPKGEIRSEALARLEGGDGIRVRPAVWEDVMRKKQARTRISDRRLVFGASGRASVSRKGKRMNLQAIAVAREIAVRESGRGFLGWSARYHKLLKDGSKAFSRYRRLLSEANIKIEKDEKVARFTWPGDNPASAGAVRGLSRDKAQAAIARSISELNEDVRAYIENTHEKDLKQSFSLLERVILKK